MNEYYLIFSFALAYFIAFGLVPIVRVLAFKLNAVDVPKDERRMHKKPIPRWGGVAIYAGFLISVACFAPVIDERLIGILIGSVIIVIVGIFDDKYALPAWVKLLGQCVAAIIVIAFGVRINAFNGLWAFTGNLAFIKWFSMAVTFVWIIGVTNAINLIDGLDGLAVSVSGISSFALIFISILTSRYDVAVLFASVAGACMGFRPYNVHPAKIFMGDSGALFLGYILSTLSIDAFLQGYSAMSIIVPIIVLALPIFDTSFAIVRRLYRRQGIMSADRGHLHHRLVDGGFTQKETVSIMSTFSALLSITAVILVAKGFNRAIVLVGAMAVMAFCIKLYRENKEIAKKYIEGLETNRGDENGEN